MHIANLGTRVLYCDHGSFDTHASQLPGHAKLWTEVSEAVSAFLADLREHNASDNVVMLLFTEFGRRVEENASLGTDHGTATPMFIFGTGVDGGMYSRHPSLTDLDDGNLKMTTDFRSVYAALLDNWMGVDSTRVLGKRFPTLAVL